MLSDDELVEQIRAGDADAVETLIKRYYTPILRYCRWHCHDRVKAEDLTQETFYRVVKNLSGYHGKNRFKSWIYTIANHLCVDESRKVVFYPLEKEEDITEERDEIQLLEDKEEVSYYLSLLSAEQRETILLRFGEQLAYKEIAKVMNCNLRTAQSRVRNGLEIMRKEQSKNEKNK